MVGEGFLELRAFHGLLVVGSSLVVQFFGVQLFYGGGQVFLSLGLFMICLEWVFGVGLFKIGLV